MANKSILSKAEIAALEECVPPDVKKRLLAAARERYGDDIHPVYGKKDINDCFVIFEGYYTFWYNRANHETHLQKEPINSNQHQRSFT